MKRIWILVANQAEAQIYSGMNVPGDLSLVATLTHEEGAAHKRDLASAAPGRVHDRMGQARHSMEPDVGVREKERRRFAKQIVTRLQSAHLQGDFDRLVLLASPAVLGVIRKMLSGDLSRAVVMEIPKDVVGQGMEEIHRQLSRSFALS